MNSKYFQDKWESTFPSIYEECNKSKSKWNNLFQSQMKLSAIQKMMMKNLPVSISTMVACVDSKFFKIKKISTKVLIKLTAEQDLSDRIQIPRMSNAVSNMRTMVITSLREREESILHRENDLWKIFIYTDSYKTICLKWKKCMYNEIL